MVCVGWNNREASRRLRNPIRRSADTNRHAHSVRRATREFCHVPWEKQISITHGSMNKRPHGPHPARGEPRSLMYGGRPESTVCHNANVLLLPTAALLLTIAEPARVLPFIEDDYGRALAVARTKNVPL